MQYLVSVIDQQTDPATSDETAVIDEQAGRATSDEMAAIDTFNDRLQAEGHWVFAAGLGGPSTATVIDNRDGAALFTDGPFLESKEYVGGLWIIEAPDLD